MAAARGIVFETSLHVTPPAIAAVRTDAQRLRRAISNVISNAIKVRACADSLPSILACTLPTLTSNHSREHASKRVRMHASSVVRTLHVRRGNNRLAR